MKNVIINHETVLNTTTKFFNKTFNKDFLLRLFEKRTGGQKTLSEVEGRHPIK